MRPGASPMLPVGFSATPIHLWDGRSRRESRNRQKTYVAVLQHKQRIREDPRKPGGSNKVIVFVIRIGTETIDRRNHIFGRARCDGCSWGSPCLGVVAESVDSSMDVMSKLMHPWHTIHKTLSKQILQTISVFDICTSLQSKITELWQNCRFVFLCEIVKAICLFFLAATIF